MLINSNFLWTFLLFSSIFSNYVIINLFFFFNNSDVRNLHFKLIHVLRFVELDKNINIIH